jgi:hypothetical protein
MRRNKCRKGASSFLILASRGTAFRTYDILSEEDRTRSNRCLPLESNASEASLEEDLVNMRLGNGPLRVNTEM